MQQVQPLSHTVNMAYSTNKAPTCPVINVILQPISLENFWQTNDEPIRIWLSKKQELLGIYKSQEDNSKVTVPYVNVLKCSDSKPSRIIGGGNK